MSTRTKIEWTEQTWNPSTGCTKVSPGCEHCYAEIMARRLKAMGVRGYERGFSLTMHPFRLKEPLLRRKPTMYFVNSMSDLFHEDIPDSFIEQVFGVMKQTPHHTFQVLTKRAERMALFLEFREVPENVWIGVTVENRRHGIPRIECLKTIRSSVRFLSVEPLLEDLGFIDLTHIQWVIAGGESGQQARPMKREWVENIQRQCAASGTPFFFKQWGVWGPDGKKRSKKANGRSLFGRNWDSMPAQTGLVPTVC